MVIRVRIQSQNLGSEFRVRIQGKDLGSGFRVRIKGPDFGSNSGTAKDLDSGSKANAQGQDS